jgi:D-erythro-7,8-dihydroneopterin triphosphate epimerase
MRGRNMALMSSGTSTATIKITNLRLRTYIGFNQEEQEKRQDVIVNISIRYPAEKASLTDDVDNALNYKTISKAVIQHVEEGRFLLLEKLVSDVLGICCDHPWVQYASVTIDKPHALRFADSVSLTLEHFSD